MALIWAQNWVRDFFQTNGIEYQLTCVYTPQQNGVAERKHRHILTVAWALLFQPHLPLSFWEECVLTAVYLINRLPPPLLSTKSPFELLYNRPPSFDHLKVFGCLCYAIVVQLNQKFDPRAKCCIFVGYPIGKKCYKLYDLETHKFFVSRDVKFCETIFPFSSISTPPNPNFVFPSSFPNITDNGPSSHPFPTINQPTHLPNSTEHSPSLNPHVPDTHDHVSNPPVNLTPLASPLLQPPHNHILPTLPDNSITHTLPNNPNILPLTHYDSPVSSPSTSSAPSEVLLHSVNPTLVHSSSSEPTLQPTQSIPPPRQPFHPKHPPAWHNDYPMYN